MNSAQRRTAAIAGLAVALLLAGCAGSADSPAVFTNVTAVTVPDDGQGTAQGETTAAEDSAPLGTFVVSEVTGHEIVPDTAIVITVEDKQLGVQAGCNAMGGAYTIVGQTLLVQHDGLHDDGLRRAADGSGAVGVGVPHQQAQGAVEGEPSC